MFSIKARTTCPHQQVIEVNLNNKPKGLYVIKVEIDNKFITNKILLE